jgi:hypothetical protein
MLAVSKGLQAAMVSQEGNRGWAVDFCCHQSRPARTVSFSYWLVKYRMLVKDLSCIYIPSPYPTSSGLQGEEEGAHTTALLLGLRPPLQLSNLSITHPKPLKLLQHVDPQQLTVLRLIGISRDPDPAAAVLAAQGRFSKLRELRLDSLLPVTLSSWRSSSSSASGWSFDSSLAQLTALECLKISGRYPPAGWQHIPSQLQSLDCHLVDDEALSNMHHLVQLTKLVVYNPEMTGAALATMGRCMLQLRILKIQGRGKFDVAHDQLRQAMQAMSALQELQLSCLPKLTQQHVASIAQASSLTSLKLQAVSTGYAPIDLSDLAMLRKLHHLAVKINHSALATFDNSFTDLTLLKSLVCRAWLRRRCHRCCPPRSSQA